MQQWEKQYNKWFMGNSQLKILNTLDKHSEMSNYDLMQRLWGASKEVEKEEFMRSLFKSMYQQQQQTDKGTITIDTKQIDREADKIIDELQKAIDKHQ